MVEEQRERIKKAIYKALYCANNSLDVSGDIPSTRKESQFLIGLVFRSNIPEQSPKRIDTQHLAKGEMD